MTPLRKLQISVRVAEIKFDALTAAAGVADRSYGELARPVGAHVLPVPAPPSSSSVANALFAAAGGVRRPFGRSIASYRAAEPGSSIPPLPVRRDTP